MRVTRRAGRVAVAALAAGAVLLGAFTGALGAAASAAPAGFRADDRPSSPAEPASGRALTPGSGPVSLAVVVPITVPTSAQGTGLIDAPTLAIDTAPTGVLTRELDAVSGTAAVLAIDPMILVSIRVLGTAAPASARLWLQELEALPNEKMPLAYADADPGVLVRQPGGAELLADLDFQFAVVSANFGPARSASPTPTPTSGATEPTPSPTPSGPAGPTPRPTNEDLLAPPGSYIADDIAWPAAGTVTEADLAPLAAAGYDTVLLGSGNTSSADSGHVRLDGIDGLVSDDGLSSIARDAVGATGDVALQAALQRFDAALAGMQAVSPGRSVIATLQRGWSVSATHVRELLQNVDAQPAAQTVGLSAVLASPALDARIVDGRLPADGAAVVPAVVGTVAPEAAFATIAGDRAAEITSPRRLELLSTMSVAWVESSSGAWPTRLRAYLASSTALLDKVKIVHGSDVLVTATSTTIPVTVSNALPVPISVDVTVIPEATTVLRVTERRMTLRVEPNATNRALVPAQALGTQTVTAGIVLHSTLDPTVVVGQRESIEVNLRPSWEGIGTAIFGGLVVLIFGGGIVRQVLKRRRARREREASTADPAPVPAPDDAPAAVPPPGNEG